MNKLIKGVLISLIVTNTALAAVNTAPHATQYIFLDSSIGTYSTDMEFPPSIPQTFDNPLFWTVNAKCTIETNEAAPIISIKAKKGTGRVNGTELSSTMDAVMFTVHNQQVLNLSADRGASVELINKGSETIKAHCSL